MTINNIPSTENIQKAIDALVTSADINATNKAVTEALNAAQKSPIRVINLLNSVQFRDIQEVKAARQLLGAGKWSLDMLQTTTDPETGRRVIVKTGKALKAAQDLEAYASEDGHLVTFIDDHAFCASIFEEFTMTAFIREALQVLKKRTAIQRAALTAELKAAKKAEKAEKKAAEKAEKKAQKKASKAAEKKAQKTAPARDMLREMFDAGILTQEQYDAQLAKLAA